MKLSLTALDRQIEKLEASIERVKTSAKFTNADRKILLPYYEAQLKKATNNRERTARKNNVFGELPKRTGESNPFYAEQPKYQTAKTPPQRHF